jgi:UDP-N-acetylmuramate dehydrogenase
MKQVIRELREAMPGLVLKENEPLSGHLSFRIGGPAAVMALPDSPEQLTALTRILYRAGIKPLLLGNGTNLLAAERPLDIFVIKTSQGLNGVQALGDNRLKAQCGATLSRLAVFAANLGLGGLEFAHGIPGTLGGAVVMNAGAYGGEMKDVLESVQYLDKSGELHDKKAGELSLGYRHSVFSETDDLVVSAVLAFSPGDEKYIRQRMDELAKRRRQSQPLELPSAGSTFKRPKDGYAAALIEQAGLKGFSIGGAAVSGKHAGFVVNTGGAGFDEVMALIGHIQQTVFARFGIELEPEIKIIR